MSLTKRHILISLFVLSVPCLFWFLTSKKEPAHNGKSLSKWLEIGLSDPSHREEAQEAIQAIGEDALPYLERRLREKRSKVRLGLMSLAFRLGFRSLVPPDRLPEQTESLFGFEALGEQSMLTLRRLLKDGDSSIRLRAMLGVARLGTLADAAIPELSDILRNDKEAFNRGKAAETLGLIGSNRNITDLLIVGLNDPDAQVRLYAALALGRFDMSETIEKEKSFNVLFLVGQGQHDGRELASRGRLDSSATNAIPALTKVLDDPSKSVRAAARFALDQIAVLSTNRN